MDIISQENKRGIMQSLSQYIDHTLLAANATEDGIKKLCQEAIEHSFYSVCVNSGYVKYAHECVSGSAVKVCSVVGFPLGAMASEAKAYEAKVAIGHGAQEIDMVINIGWLKSERLDLVKKDISMLRDACAGVVLKVILETALLDDDEIVEVCDICRDIEVDFVKTSTGFSTGGATVEDVRLMKQTVGDAIEVKASGGVRTANTAREMIRAGATRLGTSSGIAIVVGSEDNTKGY